MLKEVLSSHKYLVSNMFRFAYGPEGLGFKSLWAYQFNSLLISTWYIMDFSEQFCHFLQPVRIKLVFSRIFQGIF